jgi:DNA-binding Lrp family transcriptional regulator
MQRACSLLTPFTRFLTRPSSQAQSTALPEVQELHHVAGEDRYLVKVRVPDTEELGRLLREKIGGIGSVRSTRTTIVLETIKETGRLPLRLARRRA